MFLPEGMAEFVEEWAGRVRTNIQLAVKLHQDAGMPKDRQALYADLAVRTLSNILAGRNYPAFDSMAKLAWFYGIAPDDWFLPPTQFRAMLTSAERRSRPFGVRFDPGSGSSKVGRKTARKGSARRKRWYVTIPDAASA